MVSHRRAILCRMKLRENFKFTPNKTNLRLIESSAIQINKYDNLVSLNGCRNLRKKTFALALAYHGIPQTGDFVPGDRLGENRIFKSTSNKTNLRLIESSPIKINKYENFGPLNDFRNP